MISSTIKKRIGVYAMQSKNSLKFILLKPKNPETFKL